MLGPQYVQSCAGILHKIPADSCKIPQYLVGSCKISQDLAKSYKILQEYKKKEPFLGISCKSVGKQQDFGLKITHSKKVFIAILEDKIFHTNNFHVKIINGEMFL